MGSLGKRRICLLTLTRSKKLYFNRLFPPPFVSSVSILRSELAKDVGRNVREIVDKIIFPIKYACTPFTLKYGLSDLISLAQFDFAQDRITRDERRKRFYLFL